MADDSIQIGLWGGPGSGKTTYLAALRTAALLDEKGEWRIEGQDDVFPGSTMFLAKQTNLLRHGQFPGPTTSVADYGYKITGTVARGVFDQIFSLLKVKGELKRRLFNLLPLSKTVTFNLHIRDYPGGSFASPDYQDELWQYLADCSGLILLFDPDLEKTKRSNFEYLQQATDFLSQMMQARGKLIDERIPQYLAVCLTKFDDPVIFQHLREADLIQFDPGDPRGTPSVRDAQQAFRSMADPLTAPTIERYFHKKRTRYFVTSSVGFYTDDAGKVNLDDCSNVIDTPEGKRIRGPIVPVNVLAPLIWIEKRASRVRP